MGVPTSILPTTARELASWAVEREQAFQHPDELGELAELLDARLPARPRILEIGLGCGGSVWLWRQLWPEAFIAGVDRRYAPCEGCERRRAHSGCARLRIRRTVDQFVLGDSVRDAREVVGSLLAKAWIDTEEEAALFDFVHIDADHSYDAVRSDVETYGPLATCALALHDTLAYPGVRRLISEIRAVAGPYGPGRMIEIGEEPQGYGYAVFLR